MEEAKASQEGFNKYLNMIRKEKRSKKQKKRFRS